MLAEVSDVVLFENFRSCPKPSSINITPDKRIPLRSLVKGDNAVVVVKLSKSIGVEIDSKDAQALAPKMRMKTKFDFLNLK